MSDLGWEWDPSLYAGSAAYYVRGRAPYGDDLAEAIVAAAGLDGTGRLLDVGCGPGSLTLLLAPWFEQATGLDADAEMLAEGARQAAARGIGNVDWVHQRAEQITDALGLFRAVTLAQSFHWMPRARVAGLLHERLTTGGVLVHVHATTHEGVDSERPLPHPEPPRREIGDLVERFLGSRRRAGAGTLPEVAPRDPGAERVEDGIYRAAGFTGPTRVEVAGRVVRRSADEIVASVFSLSSAAPHLFADRVEAFETALRALLARAGPDGWFSEQLREAAVDVWRV